MGNILIAFGVLALVLFIIYLIKDKEVQEEFDKGWLDVIEQLWDEDILASLIALSVALLVVSWAISSGITKGMVTEKYKEQRETTLISYKGTGDNVFTLGRRDGCYYALKEVNGKLEEVRFSEGSIDLVPSTFDGKTATLISEVTVRKIRRSKMPFMFLNKNDKTKESAFCGCGSNSGILNVPSNFVFDDH
jgi:hypothetical protein